MSRRKQDETTKNYRLPFNYKDDPLVEFIIKEIAQHTPVSRLVERELFAEYQNPNTTTKRKESIKIQLINVNMRFVLNYALNYKHFPIHLSDIISAGKMGLMEAIEKFDLDRNKKFISFAVWNIKSHVSKLLEEADLIKLPSHQKVKLNREKKLKDFSQFDEETKQLLELTQTKLSYDSPVSSNSDLKISEVIADLREEDPESKHIRSTTSEFLDIEIKSKLKADEYRAICLLFGLKSKHPMGLRETGSIMGKSHERIRQLRDASLRKLRKSVNMSHLRKLVMPVVD